MGTCQSAAADPLIGRSVTVDKDVPQSPMRSPLRKLLRKSNKNKLSIIIDNNNSNNRNGPMSPSEETQPETPMSSLLSPSSSTTKKRPEPKTPTTLVSMIAAADMMSPARSLTTESDTNNTCPDAFDEIRQSSLMGLENIMIPEETDPDAPSDEEESYLRYVEQTHKQHGVSAWEMEPGPIFSAKSSSSRGMSPPRPQTAIKLKHKKITRPGSIQHHHVAPLVVPPPGTVFLQTPKNPQSVERSHLAAFQKLKVQAQLQQHEAKLKRRSEKFEDRYADVQEYRKLYKEFEDMQSSVEDVLKERPPMLRRSKSFDLKETDSWWYNFHSMADDDDDDEDDGSDEDSIYSHQSQYSLLSAASMESQRRFFAAKKAKTTSSKLKALDDILQGIQDKKNPKAKPKQRHDDDYGPTSGTNSKRRLSISSDYGPTSVVSSIGMSDDYGPLSNNSRRPSTSSSIVTIERSFQGDATTNEGSNEAPNERAFQGAATTNNNEESNEATNDEPNATTSIDLSSQSNVMKFMAKNHDDDEQPSRPDDETYLGGGGMMKYMMASAYLSEPRSPSPNNDGDDEAETPVITNITTSGSTPPKSITSGTPKSRFVDDEEDEKKDDPDDRQPIWRTFEENDRTSPELYRPSVVTMTTQDFLSQSDNDALLVVRSISRLEEDEEDDDTVVRARRLDFFD